MYIMHRKSTMKYIIIYIESMIKRYIFKLYFCISIYLLKVNLKENEPLKHEDDFKCEKNRHKLFCLIVFKRSNFMPGFSLSSTST